MDGLQSRRQFVQGVGVVGLALVAGCGRLPGQAQPSAKIPRIGLLLGGAPGPSPLVDAFREGLSDLGYVEGETILIERRYAEAKPERYAELAAELVRLPVDVLVATGGEPLLTVHQATATIPIVMPSAGDPVGQGLIASLARPGGNITGLTGLAQELSGKRVELLKETVPSVSRVAVLWNAANTGKALEFQRAEEAATQFGLRLQSLAIHRGAEDLEPVFQQAARDPADALLVLSDSFSQSHNRRIVEFTEQNRLPSVSTDREFVAVGGLLAYGPIQTDLWRRSAIYVDRILRGAKPADLPVERPTKFHVIVNLKTAQALGLTIPPHVLAQATEVLQ